MFRNIIFDIIDKVIYFVSFENNENYLFCCLFVGNGETKRRQRAKRNETKRILLLTVVVSRNVTQ